MKFSLNLASRSYVNRRALYTGYAALAAVLVITLLLNLLTMYGMTQQTSRTQEKIDALKQTGAAQQSTASTFTEKGLTDLQKSISSANDVLERDSFRWTELLDRLERLMPNRVKVRDIAPDHSKKTIALSCEAKDLTALKLFLDKLYSSGYYERVLLSQQALDEKTSNINFTVQLQGAF